MVEHETNTSTNKIITPAPTAPNYKSPYYLHPFNRSGLSMCSIALKGPNYAEWSSSMTNSLWAKRKLGFIYGRITKPADDSDDLDDWYTVNSMLIGWIVQSVDSPLRPSITYSSTVKALWDDLKQRFSIGIGPRKLQLCLAIASSRQQGQYVSDYYAALKKLWEELAIYVPPKTCSCGLCKCNLSSELLTDRDEEQAHQFLICLDNATFSSLRSNLLAQDPLPPISRIYSLAVQEERLCSVVNNQDSSYEAHAFAARKPQFSPTDGKSVDRKSLLCAHYGKKGHDKTTCFKIHGYLDWMKERSATSRASASATASTSTPAKSPSGSALAAQIASVVASSQPPTSQDRNAFSPTLNNEQWTVVMNLFNSMNTNTDSSCMAPHWILDTGASYHMTRIQVCFAISSHSSRCY